MPIVPDKVFLEVISITLDQFKFLRDGGDYIEEGTGQKKHFEGQLFEPVVFDDSVKEFLALKKKLADYFDEKSVEDIFDYIPHVLDNYEEEQGKEISNMDRFDYTDGDFLHNMGGRNDDGF